jgi:hypothetical protein
MIILMFLTRLNWDVMGGLPGSPYPLTALISRLSTDGVRTPGIEAPNSWAEEPVSLPCHLSKLHLQVSPSFGQS